MIKNFLPSRGETSGTVNIKQFTENFQQKCVNNLFLFRSAIVYLNDEFKGGEFVFADSNGDVEV